MQINLPFFWSRKPRMSLQDLLDKAKKFPVLSKKRKNMTGGGTYGTDKKYGIFFFLVCFWILGRKKGKP